MKKLYLLTILVLCAFSAFSQTQLGADIDGEAAGDLSGNAVSISADGSIVAIGARNNSGNGTSAGHVRVYQYTAGAWVQLGADIDGEDAGDLSGYSVSISANGSTVAIGTPYNGVNDNNAGHVRIYKYATGAWTQLGADIDGKAANDNSGCSVSMSADGVRVAIGASGSGGNGVSAGQVRIYEYASGTWTQLGADINGEAAGDNCGYSVSLSADGSMVAIGAVNNDGNGNNAGHVRIYKYTTGAWIQVGADIDGEAADDRSGISVSLSADGSTVSIGAIFNNGNGASAGHVRVFRYLAGSWTKLGADIDGEAADDYCGNAVSMSANGSIVAIGAYANDGNGAFAGQVRVYQFTTSTWTQLGADIDAEAAGDLCGYSVSVSANGSLVAIGAYVNDGNGNNAGHVRVYQMCELYNIAKQPNNVVVNVGADATFVVGANYSAYQWQCDTGSGFQNLTDGVQFLGTNNDTLIVKSIQLSHDGDKFRCVVGTFACSDTTGVATLSVQKSSGIADLLGRELIIISPNPTNSQLTLNINAIFIGASYSICNLVGKEIKTGTLLSENTPIDLEDLTAGTYMLKLLNKNTSPIKIIKL